MQPERPTAGPAGLCVLTTQRTGSTWLMQLLRQSPDLRAYGEIFLPTTSEAFRGDPRLKPPSFFHEFAPLPGEGRRRLLNRYMEMIHENSTTAPAFKIMYDQVRRMPWIMPMLRQRRYVVVHLIRRNSFTTIISRLLAFETNIYHSRTEIAQPTLHADARGIVRLLRRIDFQVRIAKASLVLFGIPHISVDYENLAEDPQREIKRIMDFAKLRRYEFNSGDGWVKTNKRRPDEIFENFPEIERAIQKTRYRWMLEAA